MATKPRLRGCGIALAAFAFAAVYPASAFAQAVWQKIAIPASQTGGTVPCTKVITTGSYSVISPIAFSYYYTLYGGGGGASSSSYAAGGGGGGSTAIVVGGSLAVDADGGHGGSSSAGSAGSSATDANGTALSVSAGQSIQIYVGGGGGGGGGGGTASGGGGG